MNICFRCDHVLQVVRECQDLELQSVRAMLRREICRLLFLQDLFGVASEIGSRRGLLESFDNAAQYVGALYDPSLPPLCSDKDLKRQGISDAIDGGPKSQVARSGLGTSPCGLLRVYYQTAHSPQTKAKATARSTGPIYS
jgi:hypothetical protein